MAITIKNNSYAFDNLGTAMIVFRQYDSNNIRTETIGDFTIIFEDDKVAGINIFNVKKYFHINEGYHQVDELVKNYLLKKFANYLTKKDFESFFKIGKIIKIEAHPSIEKLKIMQVQFNDCELQILTNVQTIKIDNKYLFALNGATLANGTQILETKVANVLSQGMIVSYSSIGVNKEGIIECNELNLEDEYKF